MRLGIHCKTNIEKQAKQDGSICWMVLSQAFLEVGLSLAGHAYVQPYEHKFLNRLELGTLVASFVAVPWMDALETFSCEWFFLSKKNLCESGGFLTSCRGGKLGGYFKGEKTCS